MTIRLPLLLVLVLSLLGCFPKKPGFAGLEIPPGPCLRAVEKQRSSVSTVKALASLEVSRKGRKRVFETVGIVAKRGGRFRVEAYDPLGLSLLELIWDGDQLLFSTSGDPSGPPPAGLLERLLGASIDPAELGAILSGTVPVGTGQGARAYEGQGQCILELRERELTRRIYLQGPDREISSYELIEAGRILFRVRFERREGFPGDGMPRLITIESPLRKGQLVVEYLEIELNTPLNQDAFSPRR